MEERRCVYRVSAKKLGGKRSLGRPRPSWEGSINMNLQEVDWVGVGVCGGLIWPGYGQVVGTCECGNEPSVSIQCGEFLD
jgi:hypothetical protein